MGGGTSSARRLLRSSETYDTRQHRLTDLIHLYPEMSHRHPAIRGRGPQVHTGNMTKYRNYWIFSIACFVVWGVILAVVAAQGKSDKTHTILGIWWMGHRLGLGHYCQVRLPAS